MSWADATAEEKLEAARYAWNLVPPVYLLNRSTGPYVACGMAYSGLEPPDFGSLMRGSPSSLARSLWADPNA